MASASIYGLYDKESNLRYIGKANCPTARLVSHMRDARRRKTPVHNWLNKHGIPRMEILEAECIDWREAERRLISEARARGDRLLNVADGGDEPHCDKETRAQNGRKVAAAIHSDEARKRFWALKRQLGESIKRGFVSERTMEKMKARPDVFGDLLANASRV